MTRYIDADKAIEEARLSYCKDCNSYNGVGCSACGFDDAMTYIEDEPAADVEEVKHGEWLPNYETFVDEWERESEPLQTGWVCSLCGRQEFQRESYCHCGAKMDGGEQNDR